MRGQAALAMWWDMAPDQREEFERWHTHEHFPERLALPVSCAPRAGPMRAGGEGFFVLYELADYDALVSPQYLERLNAPSAWSRRMMPHHRNMVRSPCRVLEGRGDGVASYALSVRFSPVQASQEVLRSHLGGLVQALPGRPGLDGAHLLRTDALALAPTTEQKIRGLADAAANWIFIVTGDDAQALSGLAENELSDPVLQGAGAKAGARSAIHALRLALEAGPSR